MATLLKIAKPYFCAQKVRTRMKARAIMKF